MRVVECEKQSGVSAVVMAVLLCAAHVLVASRSVTTSFFSIGRGSSLHQSSTLTARLVLNSSSSSSLTTTTSVCMYTRTRETNNNNDEEDEEESQVVEGEKRNQIEPMSFAEEALLFRLPTYLVAIFRARGFTPTQLPSFSMLLVSLTASPVVGSTLGICKCSATVTDSYTPPASVCVRAWGRGERQFNSSFIVCIRVRVSRLCMTHHIPSSGALKTLKMMTVLSGNMKRRRRIYIYPHHSAAVNSQEPRAPYRCPVGRNS